MRQERSKKWFSRACTATPGGVNSPVRGFNSVGGDPVFIARAEGPYIYDADGNRFIDFVCSWGPMILGHAAPGVVEAVLEAAKDGTSFGWATPREVELAERIIEAVPSVEQVRFVNSGTEATMSAARLARAYTGRDRLIKFAGCYHGHGDAFLSQDAGSGMATLGIPGSSGVPEGAARDTITVPYNDLAAVEQALEQNAEQVAAVIVEPVAANMGMVKPRDGFLAGLRTLCTKHGAVLIFDEVMTGFRLGLAGAQGYFDVHADLTTFGKVIGGGLPVGAYGGRADIMAHVAPLGGMYQAGTLSGNPLAMAAGLATLEQMREPRAYEELEERCQALEQGIDQALAKHGRPARFDRVASMFYFWFADTVEQPPTNYKEVKQGQTDRFASFFHALLEQGVAIAPSAFEVGFVSLAHEHKHIDATVTAIDKALGTVVGG